MKKSIILTIGLCVAFLANATVRTVSSNPSNLGQFNTIQAAIDASSSGDTVYVYGSPNTYAGFQIMDKVITVLGPGWSPDKNLPLLAVVDGASIRNSPAGGSPDGSELHGLVFINTVIVSRNAVGGDVGTNNIRLIRCQFSGSVQWDLSSSGFLIEGCIFYNNQAFNSSATYQAFLFQNNYFLFQTCCLGQQFGGLTNSVNVRFDHNLFTSTNNAGGSTVAVFNSNCRFLSFSNNIFNQANVGLNVSFSTFNNNITNNVTLNNSNATSNATPWAVNSNVDGGGNVANQSPQMAAQTDINAGSSNPLLDFTIAAGPANNSGSDGKDMGLLFDVTGSLHWTNSRNGRVPRIFSMNITTPSVAPGGTLSVTVDARKSN
ncbi:MAG TPA: hypothetical protein VFE50_02100 [Cyclobacteriaceae bacterium]|nr:hypothetical protein [Cyclobacteriaceae bacterium]